MDQARFILIGALLDTIETVGLDLGPVPQSTICAGLMKYGVPPGDTIREIVALEKAGCVERNPDLSITPKGSEKNRLIREARNLGIIVDVGV